MTQTAINSFAGFTASQQLLAGNNTVGGGAGADTFAFNTAGKTTANHDWIVDFEHGTDTIATNFFSGLGTVTFATGTTPNTPTDASAPAIFYRSDYGGILFDAGAGQNGFIEIARVINHATATVTASDFVLAGATF